MTISTNGNITAKEQTHIAKLLNKGLKCGAKDGKSYIITSIDKFNKKVKIGSKGQLRWNYNTVQIQLNY